MKRVRISEIRGGEILANPVISSEYHVLLAEGTVLQKEYIENLKDLGITEVYIHERRIERSRGEIKSANREIEKICEARVKNILEQHVYQDNRELEKLRETATVIIENILEEENGEDNGSEA